MCNGSNPAKRRARILFKLCHRCWVVADTDDFEGRSEKGFKIFDHAGRKLDRVFLQIDVRSERIANEPILPAKYPDVDTVGADEFYRASRDLRPKRMLRKHLQFGARKHTTVEAGDRSWLGRAAADY